MDPNALFMQGNFNEKTNLLDEGIIIKINVPNIVVETLEKSWSNRPYTGGLTCVSSCMATLRRDFGIEINEDTFIPKLAPSQAINALLKNGIKDLEGKPVEFEIVLFNESSLDTWRHRQNVVNSIILSPLLVLPAVLILTGLIN